MRFARVGDHGYEIPIAVDGSGQVRDLRPLIDDLTPDFFASGGIKAVEDAATTLPRFDIQHSRFGAPIARPSAILCIGLNYRQHVVESGAALPSSPVLFLKTPNTLAGPNDPISIPPRSSKTDWEVELGVVIGRRASYLESPEEGLRHIAGFVAANDLSERAFQLEESGGQWSKGKCAPGFTPIGPWLATTDEVDHDNLRLRTWVNGQLRQDSSTGDMIFGVDYIVWHLSQYLTLEPGDLILTGTPEGVALSGKYPFLRPGDWVEIEIEGLGRQSQHVVL